MSDLVAAGTPATPPGLPGLQPPARGRRKVARHWWAVAVAVVVGVAVLMDLSTQASPSYRRDQLRGFLATTAGDVAQCQHGVQDALSAYLTWASTGAASARHVASTFTTQATAACSFTNEGVATLGTTQPARSIDSPAVRQIATQADAWAYLDAFTCMQDLQRLIAQPDAGTVRRAVLADVAALGTRRSRIESLVASAEQSQGMSGPGFDLPLVGTLLPAGSLPQPPAASK